MYCIFIIPRVKWVEKRVLLAVKYIRLYLTKKYPAPAQGCKKEDNFDIYVLSILYSRQRSVLLMTTVQPTQVSDL